jgi:hypothetical protein
LSCDQASLSGSHEAATENWGRKLLEELQTWLGLLVRYQSEAVLDKSGLGPMLERAQAVARLGPAAGAGAGALAKQPGLDPQTVAGVMRAFYAGLFATPQFERLQSPNVRQMVRARVAHQPASILHPSVS